MNKEDDTSWLVGAKNAFDDGMKDGMNNKPKKNGKEVWPIHHVAIMKDMILGMACGKKIGWLWQKSLIISNNY